jgi:hypothetical protein
MGRHIQRQGPEIAEIQNVTIRFPTHLRSLIKINLPSPGNWGSRGAWLPQAATPLIWLSLKALPLGCHFLLPLHR